MYYMIVQNGGGWMDDRLAIVLAHYFFFFSSRRRHTRLQGDWSSDVCSSDLPKTATANKSTKSRSGQPSSPPIKLRLATPSAPFLKLTASARESTATPSSVRTIRSRSRESTGWQSVARASALKLLQRPIRSASQFCIWVITTWRLASNPSKN